MTIAQPTPSAPKPPATPSEARQFADALIETMSALLRLVERETELVRAGHVAEAMMLEPRKSELSRRYVGALALMKSAKPLLARHAPDSLAALQRHHVAFRGLLEVNLTVLATAHAVSEGIVRGVNAEMQRRAAPSTYTAAGMHNAVNPRHAAPLAVSRSL